MNKWVRKRSLASLFVVLGALLADQAIKVAVKLNMYHFLFESAVSTARQ